MPAAYKVYVDWSGNGDFTGAGENVTQRVLDARQRVTMNYGRDQARNLSPIRAGEAAFILDNADRVLSPENTGSSLYGLVAPGRRVQITATVSSVETVMFNGYLDDFDIMPDSEEEHVRADCVDALGRLIGQKVSTGVYRGLRTGEAVAVLLDAVGWPAADRDLDVGATVMPYWWLDEGDAYEALMDLVHSEGPPALATVNSSGWAVFRDRHHRLQRAPSLTSQSTWYSSGSLEPGISPPATYNHGWKEIINSVTFQLPLRTVGDPSPVWESQGQISIPAGDTLPIVAQASDPFMNAIVPVQTTLFDAETGEPDGDYTLMSGTVTITLSRTSGQSTTIFVSSVGGAVIADLRLRASSITAPSTIQVQSEDQGSVAEHGRRSLPDGFAPKWAGRGDAAAISSIILGQRVERLPTISVTMAAGSNSVRLAQQLGRDLSDRVHLIETHTGLDSDCFVEQIGHDVGEGGADHRTSFGLEKIPSQIVGAFLLGTSQLGTGVLGRRGFTDPSVMIVLGTQATLGTNVLTP